MDNTTTSCSSTKWQCQHCLRWYSKHYKHKLHLTKCIVYQNKCNKEYDVMLQMKDEIKQECIKLFQQMMQDFKQDIPMPSTPIQSAPIVKKKIHGWFA